MFKIANKILVATMVISAISSCSDNKSKLSNPTGYYQEFSFKKNTGEERLDTLLSKNSLKGYYYYQDYVNDSFQIIYFFYNYRNNVYADFDNAKKYFVYNTANRIIYESDLDSKASGPGKEYILVNDSVYCEFTLYYFLSPPPPSDSIRDRSVWVDYTNISKNKTGEKKTRLLITPKDSIDFKKNLSNPDKFKTLVERVWPPNG